ncbi:MAG: Hsp20/alpha crystallin family protein [Candidatus Spechtbacterales bacterium]|nr:Hsp20/alpha crystallin family protein [Candidatus Spechtbacterales bacterium]
MKVTKKHDSDDKRKDIAPFEPHFVSLRDAMNRLFDESFWDPFDQSHSLVSWDKTFPKLDISETNKEVKVTANVPGVDSDNIEVEVDENSMRISGKAEKEEKQKDEKFYSYEREYGEFYREFALPADVDPDKVKADMKDGVLTVTVPKITKQRRKKAKITKK